MNFAPICNKRVPHIRLSMLRTRFFVWHKIPSIISDFLWYYCNHLLKFQFLGRGNSQACHGANSNGMRSLRRDKRQSSFNCQLSTVNSQLFCAILSHSFRRKMSFLAEISQKITENRFGKRFAVLKGVNKIKQN